MIDLKFVKSYNYDYELKELIRECSSQPQDEMNARNYITNNLCFTRGMYKGHFIEYNYQCFKYLYFLITKNLLNNHDKNLINDILNKHIKCSHEDETNFGGFISEDNFYNFGKFKGQQIWPRYEDYDYLRWLNIKGALTKLDLKKVDYIIRDEKLRDASEKAQERFKNSHKRRRPCADGDEDECGSSSGYAHGVDWGDYGGGAGYGGMGGGPFG